MSDVIQFGRARERMFERMLDARLTYNEVFGDVRLLRVPRATVRRSGLMLVTNDDGNDGQLSWFEQVLADGVARHKLFDHSTLLSVRYVASVLQRVSDRPEAVMNDVTELMAGMHSEEPFQLKMLGDTALISYILWHDERVRRSSLRHTSAYVGKHAYIDWAGRSKRPFGYHIADAFEKIGDVAHELFAPAA